MAHKLRGVMRAVGEGGMAGYGTGAAVVGGVGAAHEAARMATTARGVAASAVANRSMPGDLPGPRSAAFYANRYGFSTGAHSGTPDQLALLQQQRGVQASIRQSVETPRVAAFHNENPMSVPRAQDFPRDPHVISGSGRVPTGNPAEARRVIDRAAQKARAPKGGGKGKVWREELGGKAFELMGKFEKGGGRVERVGKRLEDVSGDAIGEAGGNYGIGEGCGEEGG